VPLLCAAGMSSRQKVSAWVSAKAGATSSVPRADRTSARGYDAQYEVPRVVDEKRTGQGRLVRTHGHLDHVDLALLHVLQHRLRPRLLVADDILSVPRKPARPLAAVAASARQHLVHAIIVVPEQAVPRLAHAVVHAAHDGHVQPRGEEDGAAGRVEHAPVQVARGEGAESERGPQLRRRGVLLARGEHEREARVCGAQPAEDGVGRVRLGQRVVRVEEGAVDVGDDEPDVGRRGQGRGRVVEHRHGGKPGARSGTVEEQAALRKSKIMADPAIIAGAIRARSEAALVFASQRARAPAGMGILSCSKSLRAAQTADARSYGGCNPPRSRHPSNWPDRATIYPRSPALNRMMMSGSTLEG
jgi:hypothetical protein